MLRGRGQEVTYPNLSAPVLPKVERTVATPTAKPEPPAEPMRPGEDFFSYVDRRFPEFAAVTMTP